MNLGDNPFRELKWDLRQLRVAKEVSTWSKDPSTQVGAVVTTPDFEPISWGYNGFPRKMEDLPEWYANREEKYRRIVHGEINALANAHRDVRGCWLYTWPFLPCSRCAVIVAQFGITRVCAPELPERLVERWGADIEFTREVFSECGITVVEVSWEAIYTNLENE